MGTKKQEKEYKRKRFTNTKERDSVPYNPLPNVKIYTLVDINILCSILLKMYFEQENMI